MMGGDVEFFPEILLICRKKHVKTWDDLKEQISVQDFDQAAKLAHKRKGQASNMGATTLQRAALALEKAMPKRTENSE